MPANIPDPLPAMSLGNGGIQARGGRTESPHIFASIEKCAAHGDRHELILTPARVTHSPA